MNESRSRVCPTSRSLNLVWVTAFAVDMYLSREPVIMNTDNFNLIYIYIIYIYMQFMTHDLCITISYVHAPNTVKRYSELRIAIPKSKRAPFTY